MCPNLKNNNNEHLPFDRWEVSSSSAPAWTRQAWMGFTSVSCFITCRAKLLKLIGWDRGHFLLIKRTLFVIKRAWLLDADWLGTPSLNLFPASNSFKLVLKRNFRNASLLSLILTRSFHLNVKENQHATKRSLLVETQKDFSDQKRIDSQPEISLSGDGWCWTKH